MPYLVDFVFLPDRDGGVQVAVRAAGPEEAVQRATAQLAKEIPSVWTLELASVVEA